MQNFDGADRAMPVPSGTRPPPQQPSVPRHPHMVSNPQGLPPPPLFGPGPNMAYMHRPMDPPGVAPGPPGLPPGPPQISAPPPYMHHSYAPPNQPLVPTGLGVRPRDWESPHDVNAGRDSKRPRPGNMPNMPNMPGMNIGQFNPNGPDTNNSNNNNNKNRNENEDNDGSEDMRNNSNNNNRNNINSNRMQNNMNNNPNVAQFPPHMHNVPPSNFPPPMHQPPSGLPFNNRPNMTGPHPGLSMPNHGRPGFPPYMANKLPPFNSHGLQIRPGMSPPAPSGPPHGPAASLQNSESSHMGQGLTDSDDQGSRRLKNGSSTGESETSNGDAASRINRASSAKSEPHSFKEFLEKQSYTPSPQEAKVMYDRYVRDFHRNQNNNNSNSNMNDAKNHDRSKNKGRKRSLLFFDEHKDEEWFKERYDPDYVLSRCYRIQKECQDRARDYHKLWRLGGSKICAPDISAQSLGCEPPVVEVEDPDYNQEDVTETEEKEVEGKTTNVEKEDVSKHVQKVNENSQAAVSEAKEEIKLGDKKEELKIAENGGDESAKMKGAVESTEAKAEEIVEVSGLENLEEKPEDDAGECTEENVERQIGKMPGGTTKNDDESPDTKKAHEKNEDFFIEKTSVPDEQGKVTDGGKIDKDEEIIQKEENELYDVKEPKEEQSKQGAPSSPQDKEEKNCTQEKSGKGKDMSKSRGKKMISLVLPLRREHEKNTIFLRGIPINLKREDLTVILAHGRYGDKDLNLRRVKIGDINPHRHLQRFAWAVYADEEAAYRALKVVRGVPVKPLKRKGDTSSDDRPENEVREHSKYTIDCMLNLERKKKYSQGRILPDVFGTEDRMKIDVAQSTRIMRFLDFERNIVSQFNPLTDEFIESLSEDSRRLDHIVTYLRETHYYCYYSGNEFLEDATSMPPQELRPVLNDKRSMTETDMRMAKRVDERTRSVLERDYDRPRSNSDSAEQARQDAVEAWLNANTVNEGEGRYRCNLPPHKLFKAIEYVHKHLKSKHGDKMRQLMDEAAEKVYRRNFENDLSKDEVISFYNEGVQSNDRGNSGSSGARNMGIRGNNGPNNELGGNGGSRDGEGMMPMGMSIGPNANGGFGGVAPPPPPPGPGGMNQMGGAPRPNMPVGMFNPATSYMGGMGMQPMPMMMMPQSRFPYPNTIPFGRGMGGSMGGPPPPHGPHPPGPPHGGNPRMPDMGKDDMWEGPPPGVRPGGGPMQGNKDGFASHMAIRSGGGGLRDSGRGESGGLRGNSMQRGGGPYHGGGGRRGGHGVGGRRGGRFDSGGEPLDPRAMGPRRNYTDLDAPAKGPSFDLVRYDDV